MGPRGVIRVVLGGHFGLLITYWAYWTYGGGNWAKLRSRVRL
jgi:hypothetical protein